MITLSTIVKQGRQDNGQSLPPLENGDRLTQAEFHRRYEAYPEDVKIELIGGVVFRESPIIHGVRPSDLLENGDRLSQQEFHRRYELYPKNVKVELVGGTVFMAAAMRDPHSAYHVELGTVFGVYKANTPGVRAGDNATIILSDESELQPDLHLRILEELGGRSRLNEQQYVVGPPELVAEIAHSTVALDLHLKKDSYKQAGVCEYIVVCVEERQIIWFDLKKNVRMKANKKGILASRIFPGLWIDTAALLEQDTKRLLEVLQQGLDSPEHDKFVKSLERKRKKRKA